MPASNAVREVTAFFIVPTNPNNFHHFWADEFKRLFTVVERTGRLRPGAENQIVYRHPALNNTKTTTFEEILFTLYTNRFHDAFINFAPGTYFRSAVFGTRIFPAVQERSIVDHVVRELQVAPSKPANFVTIVQRRHHRIVNVDEMVRAVKSIGFPKIRVVDLSLIGVVDQVRVAASTSLMIGVQGAGLRWAVFMPRGSTLVEIAWPTKYWNFYYSDVTSSGIKHRHLSADDLRVNWTSFEHEERGGRLVPIEERVRLEQNPPTEIHVNNVWKWADVRVNIDDLTKILSSS